MAEVIKVSKPRRSRHSAPPADEEVSEPLALSGSQSLIIKAEAKPLLVVPFAVLLDEAVDLRFVHVRSSGGVRRLLVGAPFASDLFRAAKHLCFAAMALIFWAARGDCRALAGGILCWRRPSQRQRASRLKAEADALEPASIKKHCGISIQAWVSGTPGVTDHEVAEAAH